MIAALANKHDPRLHEFWQAHHELPLQEAKFDPDSDLHFAFCDSDKDGNLTSVCLFVPVIVNGFFQGHVAYLASLHRNKCLIRFCRRTMEQLRKHPAFGWICVETRGLPELNGVRKLSEFLGFTPVFIPEHGWTDLLWNTKEKKGTLCHQ